MALLEEFVTDESVERGFAFRPRPTDVIVTPYAKSGTTWLQQIVHTLRTGGDEDFDDISRVVPWIETAHDLGIDLDAPQKAQPRAFKSHLPWGPIPKGARYLVSVRDPRDALVSFYRFMEGWLFEPGTISMEAFAAGKFCRRGMMRDYWAHLASWWPRRRDEDVLMLAYEHMKEDLPLAVRRIATFIGVELDDALLGLVLERASIGYMLSHKHRYDDRMLRELSERKLGLPHGSDSAKVRKGEVGSHRYELSAELLAELERIWAEDIAGPLGLPDYDAVLETLRSEATASRMRGET